MPGHRAWAWAIEVGGVGRMRGQERARGGEAGRGGREGGRNPRECGVYALAKRVMHKAFGRLVTKKTLIRKQPNTYKLIHTDAHI